MDFPDEIWLMILEKAVQKSFSTLRRLFLINKQFNRIIQQLLNRNILDNYMMTVYQKRIPKINFVQKTLVEILKGRGFTFFHTLKNGILHGLCKKWEFNSEMEYMTFYGGKLISHTVKKLKSKSTKKSKTYIAKKITFYPKFRSEKFNEKGTVKIITTSYVKALDVDNLMICDNSPQMCIAAQTKELLEYADLSEWIARECKT